MEGPKNRYTLPPQRVEDESLSFEPLTPSQSSQILADTEIHSSPDDENPLSLQEIAEAGLQPKYVKHARGADVFLSAPYVCDKFGRSAVVGYLKKQRPGSNEHPVARTFYTSDSQAMWRYLPDYQRDEFGELSWYGKGYHETSLQLPIELQEALARVELLTPNRPKPPNRERIFTGTARQFYENASEFGHRSEHTYYGSVVSIGHRLSGRYYREQFEDKSPPERLVFSDMIKWPDFSVDPEFSWHRQTELYGKISMDVFPSKDKSLRYLYCRDEKMRAWIGSIELTKAKITSTGLADNWVNAGDITTPLGEYASQDGGYGGELLDAKRHYVDMFPDYLSKSTYIKQYLYWLKHRTVEEPTALNTFVQNSELTELGIMSSTNFPDLIRTMDIHSATIEKVLAESKEYAYRFKDVMISMDLVRKGRLNPMVLPKIFGIRSKVEELLAPPKRR